MKHPTFTLPCPEPTLDEPTQRLFVYGTLRQGQGNDFLLHRGGAQFVKEVWLYGHAMFGMLSVQVADPEDKVRGEIWEVPTSCLLGPIDSLEQHPHCWVRTWIPDQHGGTWVYLIAGRVCQSMKQKDGDITKTCTAFDTAAYLHGIWPI